MALPWRGGGSAPFHLPRRNLHRLGPGPAGQRRERDVTRVLSASSWNDPAPAVRSVVDLWSTAGSQESWCGAMEMETDGGRTYSFAVWSRPGFREFGSCWCLDFWRRNSTFHPLFFVVEKVRCADQLGAKVFRQRSGASSEDVSKGA